MIEERNVMHATKRLAVPGILLAWLVAPVPAEAASPVAVHRDVAYDTARPAQKLDVYLAPSERPTPAMVYIHGGGWRGGSKRWVPRWLLDGVRKGQFSVVSVEYRFTDVATHPAQVKDCLRAIQFVRSKAAEWLLVHGDRDRIVPLEHARRLYQRLKEAGVQAELVVIQGGTHAVAGSGPRMVGRAIGFVREQLQVTQSARQLDE